MYVVEMGLVYYQISVKLLKTPLAQIVAFPFALVLVQITQMCVVEMENVKQIMNVFATNIIKGLSVR
jgi:hypothetical protein